MTSRPNIVILMCDQLGARAWPAYGHPLVSSPHIDSLAARGTVFENCYSSFPLCVPARLAFMTGKRCSNIGAWDNAAQLPPDIPTFAHFLRVLGYRTCLAGKMHFIGPDQLHGFEERVTTDICPSDFNWTADWDDPWRTMDWFHNMKNVKSAGIAERALQQDYDEEVAFHAARKIFDWARQPDERPFLLVSSFTHPHDPYVTPQRFWDLYRHDQIDMPRVPYIKPEARDPHSRRLWEQYDRGELGVTDEDIRRARHAYYGSISYVDERIGEVLDALRRTRLMDNTVIIFCSDHGDMIRRARSVVQNEFLRLVGARPLHHGRPGNPCSTPGQFQLLPCRSLTDTGGARRGRGLERLSGAGRWHAAYCHSSAGRSRSALPSASSFRKASRHRMSCCVRGSTRSTSSSTIRRRCSICKPTPTSSMTWRAILSMRA